ncbi:hypothetical protein EV175_002513 [Coemansia sp. RSA 1933]|nr:hypothetical protein EV175_002513 [Coemansia sp. RSA 1933]
MVSMRGNPALTLICDVVVAALGISAVCGAVIPNVSKGDPEPFAVITQTIVSDIDTNLSRFVPNLFAEALLAEQAAIMQGLISSTDTLADIPSPIVEKEEFWAVDRHAA